MIQTVEMRWFLESPMPPEALHWFQKGELQTLETASRVDHYLRLPDTDSLGIKLREGKIEIKQRHHEYGALRFHERVTGLVEGWYKWSFELSDDASHLGERLISTPSWMSVEKDRKLRRYALTLQKAVIAVSLSSSVTRGCNVEVTEISAAGNLSWSLAFEAFGTESDLYENLCLVAQSVFAASEPPRLAVTDSFGYPGWLSMLP